MPRPTSVENVADERARPGTFFARGSDLVYAPRKSPKASAAPTLVGPRAESVLVAKGAARVAILSLEFRHCARRPEAGGFVDKQAGILWGAPNAPRGVPQGPSPAARNRSTVASPACVAVEGGSNVVVEGCAFRQMGSAYAVAISGKSCAVTSCTFDDLSGGAVSAGTVDATIAVDPRAVDHQLSIGDNVISNTGLEFKGTTAIFAGYVAASKIEYNTLRGAPYSGISLGWGWGRLKGSLARDNRVVGNWVVDTMTLLGDGAAIYLLGAQPRTRVARNFVDGFAAGYAYCAAPGALFHRPAPRSTDAALADLDDGSAQVTLLDNVARYKRPPGDGRDMTGPSPALVFVDPRGTP